MSQIGMFGDPLPNSQTSNSLVVSLAQFVSLSVALLAKLVLVYFDGGLLLVIRCYSCDGWETKSNEVEFGSSSPRFFL